MFERLLIWLFCRRDVHAKATDLRYRLTLVNKGRRVVSGEIEGRVVCSRCGVVLTDWASFGPVDMTDDIAIRSEDWERLYNEGEVTFPFE